MTEHDEAVMREVATALARQHAVEAKMFSSLPDEYAMLPDEYAIRFWDLFLPNAKVALAAMRAADLRTKAAPEISEEMVERAAKAICEVNGEDPNMGITLDCYPPLTTWNWEKYATTARAALTAALTQKGK